MQTCPLKVDQLNLLCLASLFQTMLQERAQVGDVYMPIDALQACYIEDSPEEEQAKWQAADGEEQAAMVRRAVC